MQEGLAKVGVFGQQLPTKFSFRQAEFEGPVKQSSGSIAHKVVYRGLYLKGESGLKIQFGELLDHWKYRHTLFYCTLLYCAS